MLPWTVPVVGGSDQLQPNVLQKAPDQLVPDHDVPDQLVPDHDVPDQDALDQDVPDHDVPDQLVPDHDVPDQDVPDQLVPDHEVPFQYWLLQLAPPLWEMHIPCMAVVTRMWSGSRGSIHIAW